MPSPEPKIVYAKPVDDLPPDAGEQTTEWTKVTEFRASIAGAHITNTGELTVNLKIPFEDKYLALPVTDTRSVLMVFSVYKPVIVQHPEKADLDAVWSGDNGGN